MDIFERSTRDAAWIKLPVLLGFAAVLTYVATDAFYGLLPEYGEVTTTGETYGPALAIGFGVLAAWYVARLIWPVSFVVAVSPSAVTMSQSNRPYESMILTPNVVKGFFVPRKRWFHVEGSELPLKYSLVDGTTNRIPLIFIGGLDRDRFLDAVERHWGPSYVPKRPTPISHRRIRWWPRGLHPPAEDG